MLSQTYQLAVRYYQINYYIYIILHIYNTNANTLTNYFLSCPNVETDKRKSAKLT